MLSSVAMTGQLDAGLNTFLLAHEDEEDLLFGLWSPSVGTSRTTALVHTPLYPEEGDRQTHGNASFNRQYVERALSEATKGSCGICLLHSHTGPGWQGMSEDDIVAETRIAGPVESVKGLPLVGLTLATDGVWSARFWRYKSGKKFSREWCASVRTVGERLRVSFADKIIPPPKFRELFRRTATVWGRENHRTLARLTIGIVGLGSVGSIVRSEEHTS